MIAEAVIARTPARLLPDRTAGTLVLTTERLRFEAEEQIAFEIARTEIGRAMQQVEQLWVYPRGGGLGVGFELRSLLAGPVPWRWYLGPPESTGRSERRGVANDPRIGPIDEARRAVLEDWQRMVAFHNFAPIDHFLDELPHEPIAWDDIVEIVYIADGEGDGPPWLLVVRLANGTWVYFQHTLQITGDVFTTTVVARSLESLWWGAMTEDDRDRVTAQMTQDRVDEELVRLDEILGSTSGHPVRHAEARMLSLKR